MGYAAGISSLAFSADSTFLAVAVGKGDPQGTFIQILEVATGKEVRQIAEACEVTQALAFSPDGRTLAAWQSGRVPALVLWDIATGKVRSRFKEERFPGRGSLVFSADGKTLASFGPDRAIRLWEVATGQERHRLEGHRGPVSSVAFAPDGRRLASGGVDTTVLIWELVRRDKATARGGARPSVKEVEAWWTALTGDNAVQAYQAQQKLIAAPQETVAFFKGPLQPMAATDGKRLARLLADLDAEDFAAREKAVEELEKLGGEAEPALRQALKAEPSREAQRRIQELLEKLPSWPAARLQTWRALEVLEHIDTAAGRQLLEKLAGGAPGAWLTEEAKAIQRRLGRREKEAVEQAEGAKG
jgi:dipeptidyl aminopeptidase/acylaminoacyl peptidase